MHQWFMNANLDQRTRFQTVWYSWWISVIDQVKSIYPEKYPELISKAICQLLDKEAAERIYYSNKEAFIELTKLIHSEVFI